MKGLINIKNNENKYFLYCHIRNLDPLKMHSERIRKAIKTWLMILIMKYYCKIEQKNNICINVFCYENKLVDPAYVSDQKLDNRRK